MEAEPTRSGRMMTAVSNALVALHKEQFGRGPTGARAYFAGPDTMIGILDGALLPAEQALVEMGEQQRVRDARLFMQVATADRFTAKIEEIVGRKVYSFVSALDADNEIAYEIFTFQPGDG